MYRRETRRENERVQCEGKSGGDSKELQRVKERICDTFERSSVNEGNSRGEMKKKMLERTEMMDGNARIFCDVGEQERGRVRNKGVDRDTFNGAHVLLCSFHAASWEFLGRTKKKAAGAPMPQSGSTGSHGQPQAGSSPSTPGPGGGGSTGGATGSGAGGGAAASGTGSTSWAGKGPARRGRGWRDWRRGDPTLIKGLWKSKGPLDSLGQAEIYIIVALLIGFFTVVIGCWLSDNCWSPEPEGVVTLA
ncbi:hypothetical protein ALC60_11775 [Trachymyrmex zeteki]|uniref:Uncharacterized protein n=1 Tax=Mycetomoellerius zeteki TaxID=64791 RepID=A0A151WMY5_9HYME|nr:hypothetical protein ALC60_11775 [Trachymyrmex zeteki]